MYKNEFAYNTLETLIRLYFFMNELSSIIALLLFSLMFKSLTKNAV